MENHPDYPYELAYLQAVLDHLGEEIPRISKQKDELDARVSYALAHMNVDNPESYSELTVNLSLLGGWKTHLRQMAYAGKKPYFARVDFNGARHYIGKMTLLRDLDILITDWRAPLATLYYEGRLGEAAYDCPDGHITGELTLKRQYQIEDGKLEGFTDIDVTASDTFLQAALGASKDRRLRDIVTTIQAEQNRIIRAPLRTPLIVQGAAGSGKTTIALHRIAYLLYNHTALKPERVMILAPSQYFLSYISDVLPELGVEEVTQTTFTDYAINVLELNTGKYPVASPLAALTEAINTDITETPCLQATGSNTTETPRMQAARSNTFETPRMQAAESNTFETPRMQAARSNTFETPRMQAARSNTFETPRMQAAGLKGSLRFHELIRRYLRHIEESLLPAEDFAVEDYTLFPRGKIAELFTDTYTFLPTCKRAPEIEKYLTQTLNRRLPRIEANIIAIFDKHMEKVRAFMPEDTLQRRAQYTRIIEKRDAMIKALHEKAKPTRKKYMRTFRLKSALTYYTALFTEPGLLEKCAEGLFSPDELRILSSESRVAESRTLPAKNLATESRILSAKNPSAESRILSAKNHTAARRTLEPEDLPPLLFMHKHLFGMKNDMQHVVIDEAQDYSPFQFLALREALPAASFSIFGDLHQGMLAHKGIGSWEEVCTLFTDDTGTTAELLTLTQSYRTTIEIMDAANPVILRLYPKGATPAVPPAIPVIRHGEPVIYRSCKPHEASHAMPHSTPHGTPCATPHELPHIVIAEEITAALAAGCRSIALICKTEAQCQALQTALIATPAGKIPIIFENEADYTGGILILPVYLAKGLEFDAVIIADAAQYQTETAARPLDIKLLYIAMTRALHRLAVIG